MLNLASLLLVVLPFISAGTRAALYSTLPELPLNKTYDYIIVGGKYRSSNIHRRVLIIYKAGRRGQYLPIDLPKSLR